MTEFVAESKPSAPRRILAPQLWPFWPFCESGEPEEPVAYLSWPGWELYLRRRLGLEPLKAFYPMLLPDQTEPERDFAAIDQMARRAASEGAALVDLNAREPESAEALARAIGRGPAEPVAGRPLIDDRAYLALWSINQYQAWLSERLLAEASRRQWSMWRELKGQDDSEPQVEAPAAAFPPPGDSRGDYAWRCWERLSQGLLRSDDIIIATVGRSL